MYRRVMLLFVRSVAVYQGIYILEYYKISEKMIRTVSVSSLNYMYNVFVNCLT